MCSYDAIDEAQDGIFIDDLEQLAGDVFTEGGNEGAKEHMDGLKKSIKENFPNLLEMLQDNGGTVNFTEWREFWVQQENCEIQLQRLLKRAHQKTQDQSAPIARSNTVREQPSV